MVGIIVLEGSLVHDSPHGVEVVGLGVRVTVGVPVGTGVRVAVAVPVGTGVLLEVGGGDAVRVKVGDTVGVRLRVGEAVGGSPDTINWPTTFHSRPTKIWTS